MEIVFTVTTDFSQVKEEAADTKQKLEDLEKYADKVEANIAMTIKDSAKGLQALAGMARSLIYALSDTIDPIAGAMMDIIFSTLQLMAAVASAWATGGYTAIISVAMGIAAVTLSITGAVAVATGQADAKANIDKAGSMINTVLVGLRGAGRLF